jgi:hypothetical protein
MSDPDDNAPLPADLRFLKALVTTLAGVMILGLLAIVWLLVTRLGTPGPLPTLPESVILPADAAPAAITFARDWLIVVTEAGQVLLYDRAGGVPVSVTVLP